MLARVQNDSVDSKIICIDVLGWFGGLIPKDLEILIDKLIEKRGNCSLTSITESQCSTINWNPQNYKH